MVIKVGQGRWFLVGLKGEPEALGSTTNGEGAVGNGLHIIAAHLEVGHSVCSPELYGSNIVCLSCFLLRCYITKNTYQN